MGRVDRHWNPRPPVEYQTAIGQMRVEQKSFPGAVTYIQMGLPCWSPCCYVGNWTPPPPGALVLRIPVEAPRILLGISRTTPFVVRFGISASNSADRDPQELR
eukprot:4261689-Alexandrium_andersonii.AAC.1